METHIHFCEGLCDNLTRTDDTAFSSKFHANRGAVANFLLVFDKGAESRCLYVCLECGVSSAALEQLCLSMASSFCNRRVWLEYNRLLALSPNNPKLLGLEMEGS